jgi:ComF family protein
MAEPLAEWLSNYLPSFPKGTIVSHVPTVHSRIRLRGYDQAQLIAKLVAKKQRLTYADVLRRTKSTRQVGSTRSKRFQQLHGAFAAHKPRRLVGTHILLIDDVLTTGATLESAAETLRLAGVKKIDAAVIAHAPAKLN